MRTILVMCMDGWGVRRRRVGRYWGREEIMIIATTSDIPSSVEVVKDKKQRRVHFFFLTKQFVFLSLDPKLWNKAVNSECEPGSFLFLCSPPSFISGKISREAILSITTITRASY